MIYASCCDNEIRLWWDERNEKTCDMKYRVYVNGKSCVYTNKVYYNFKNLDCGREYEFEVQLVDQNKQIVGKTEKFKASTRACRQTVDITKPPYCAVGDGQTDNTDTINKALKELRNDKILYFPLGVYVCEEFTFNGNINLRFDAGAVLCTKNKGLSL